MKKVNCFNIGDIVKLKDDYVGDSVWKNRCKGDIGIITEIRLGCSIHWKNNGQVAWFYYEDLELVRKFTWEN